MLEYFEPTALYRLNEGDDYVEVQRLGQRCRLQFASAAELNRRRPEQHSEPFECFGSASSAYGNALIFPGAVVEFDASARSIRVLGAEEAAAIRQRVRERPICVLDQRLAEPPRGAALVSLYEHLVAAERKGEAYAVECMTPGDYEQRRAELLRGG